MSIDFIQRTPNPETNSTFNRRRDTNHVPRAIKSSRRRAFTANRTENSEKIEAFKPDIAKIELSKKVGLHICQNQT